MQIALIEQLPILETLLQSVLRKSPYRSQIVLQKAEKTRLYDLALSDRIFFSEPHFCRAQLYLVPSEAKMEKNFFCGTLLTGGMSAADPVSLSSIGEDRAVLCVQQEICLCGKNIDPFEKPIPFDRNFSLFKNLAAGFVLALTEQIFGEES